MMLLLDILRTPRRWRELPGWTRRKLRNFDPVLPGILLAVRGNRTMLDDCSFDLASVSLRIRSRIATGRYEAPERRLARRLLDPTVPVIELGACIGVLGCIINRQMRAPHVVVEANGALLDTIAHHRALNGARFEIEHAAIGHGISEVELNVHPRLVTASSGQRKGGRIERVPATTLAAIADKYGFARYQLVCDIEGAEQGLIEHEREHLQTRVSRMIVEFHPDIYGVAGRDLLVEKLASAGFTRVASDEDVDAFTSHAHGV